MIISPPFLPEGHVDEDAFLAAAMPPAFNGLYPVSAGLKWHNGLHLIAPNVRNLNLPVRAIADGKVIYVVQPDAEPSTDPKHPQNYGSDDASGLPWSDKGLVILEHTTEIGCEGNTPVVVVFYSVYMHLKTLAERPLPRAAGAKGPAVNRALQLGDTIHRKDVIGKAGQQYGRQGLLHFEICCDEANLQKLLGPHRALGWTEPDLPPTANGRTDAVFGSTYVYLPAGATTRTHAPTDHLRGMSGLMNPVQGALLQPMWVGIRYAGSATLRSYYAADSGVIRAASALPQAAKLATRPGQLIGEHVEPEGEYGLFEEAKKRNASAVKEIAALLQVVSVLPAPGISQSSPSGWYELLRFGRNIGSDTLPDGRQTSALRDAAHWRQVVTPEGLMWVDLNSPGSFKLSDADFPAFKGWQCIADDERPDDQRCDSAQIKRLLLTGLKGADREETLKDKVRLHKRLRHEAVVPLMKTLICKFPTEWDRASMKERHTWAVEPGQPEPDADPARRAHRDAHLVAMSFPDLPTAYLDAQWHFNPVEFIRTFRKCGWLSESELVQTLPSHALRSGVDSAKVRWTNWELLPKRPIRDDLNYVVKTHRVPLNRMMRKYGITTPVRQASLLGNVLQETGWLLTLKEGGASKYWYSPWHGRGMLQLTHPGNYISYWKWRGRVVPEKLEKVLVPAHLVEDLKKPAARTVGALADNQSFGVTSLIEEWRAAIEGSSEKEQGDHQTAPADSAGFYWLMAKMAMYADEPHVLERCPVQTTTGHGQQVYYRSPAFWRASAAVNLPSKVKTTYSPSLNGFDSRCCAYGTILAIVSEVRFPDSAGLLTLEYPEGYARRALQ